MLNRGRYLGRIRLVKGDFVGLLVEGGSCVVVFCAAAGVRALGGVDFSEKKQGSGTLYFLRFCCPFSRNFFGAFRDFDKFLPSSLPAARPCPRLPGSFRQLPDVFGACPSVIRRA